MYEKLRREMRKQGFSVHKLAMKSGISPSSLYHVFKGDLKFYDGWKQKISVTLNKTTKELFEEGE